MHSPDGRWWWDGQQWRPAYSPDGTWWFDGAAWRGVASTRRSRRRRWSFVALGTVAAVATAAVYAFGFYAYATHDRPELLDSTDVADAAEAGCRSVVQARERSVADRAVRIRNGNEAIEDLVAAVESLGQERLQEDLPAEDWLADWRALAQARADFAERLTADADASFAPPQTEDGYPITGRLGRAAGPDCERAANLASDP